MSQPRPQEVAGADTLSEKQRRLTTAFEPIDEAGEIADFYKRAAQTLKGDLTRTGLCVASHCLRELFGMLPKALGYPRKDRIDVNRSARHLHQAWQTSSLPLEEDAGASPTAVEIPQDVFEAAQRVVLVAAAITARSVELTSLVLTGVESSVESAAVQQVHQALQFFRSWAHIGDYSEAERPLPPSDQPGDHLSIIEEALLTRLDNMADRAADIRGVLSIANRQEGEA